MSFVKNYDPGTIRMDLPASNYIYELPLLSFADIHGSLNLSLVFNYHMRGEYDDPFHIMAGYKLNLQKCLILDGTTPWALLEEDGKCTEFISTGGVYVLDKDDQRILRRDGTNFVLENMDFSKEVYDQTGKIVSAYDKYNNLVLAYGYDGSNRLASITYRGSKTILVAYSGNRLASISYAGCTTDLIYATNQITVSHYSGMNYTISTVDDDSPAAEYWPWLNFSAVATDPDNTSIASHTATLTRSNSNTVVVSNKIGSNIVDTTTYDFPNPAEHNIEHDQIEVTNKTGVKTRLQYYCGTLRCAYEVTGSDVTFENDRYKGSVQLYKTMDELDNTQASGAVTVQDGARMLYSDSNNHWFYNIAGNFAPNATGYYLLTGWIRNANNTTLTEDCQLCISNHTSGSEIEYYPTLMPNQQWTFFAYKFYLSANSIYVFLDAPGVAELKDVRLAFYSPEIGGVHGAYHVNVAEDILIAHSSTEDVIIPVAGCTFMRGSLDISSCGTVSFSDLLRYKLNQKKGLNTTEFYCDQVKQVFIENSTAQITVRDGNGHTYSLDDCYLGNRQHTRNGILITQIVDDDSDEYLTYKTTKNGDTVVSSQAMDNYLDVVSATVDGVTTAYTRNEDLITAESVANLYSRTTTYTTDSDGAPLITATDEFGNITKYALDPDWGGVKLILLPDGTRITDSYDEDMCAMTKRTFGSTSGRSTNFEYVGGNLSGLQSGGLSYGFSYTDGKLSAVSKNGTQVETHTHTDTTTNSYYPTQSGALHSTASVFDKYGRLISIAGTLANTYDAQPSFDSSTGALIPFADTGNAQLAMSVDKVLGETARFTYDENSMPTKKEVTWETDYANKISEETFEYDTRGRLTEDDCTYDKVSNKRVTSEIEYQTEADDPAADSRVKKYTYTVNYPVGESSTTTTETTYDAYKRPVTKTYKFGDAEFEKTYSYLKTRLDYETDSAGGSTVIDYDNCGRFRSVRTDGKTTKYTYDQYGQLVREDNQALAKTYVYVYNDSGNLTGVQAYNYTTGTVSGTPVTTSFGYTADKLTSFGGSTISYNTMGCPTSYEGKNCTWSKGRLTQLRRGSLESGTDIYAFGYNAFGQRVSKSYSYLEGMSGTGSIYVGQVTNCSKQFRYDHSGRLISETIAKTCYGTGEENAEITFVYDGNTVIGMEYTASSLHGCYYFHRNPLGDVVAIYDTNGNMVAKYLYDAWGNCTISSETTDYTIANANPIRYRGYYYDDDTGLYYCNTRYYSPKWRRFISPDDTAYLNSESPNGLNLYCYCNNDPVNYADPSGNMPEWAEWLIGGAVIVGLGIATFFTGGAAGVILGAAFYGAVTGAVSSALLGGVSGAISGGWEGFLDGAANGFMMGALIGGATGALAAGLNYITGGVRIVGSAQKTGNLFHRFSSNIHAGKFAMQIGRYSEIGLNAKLKSVGLSGARRPDVTAVARFGKSKLIEVVSKTQTVLSQQQKIASMLASNPGTTGCVVSWALQHWFYF